MTKFCESCIYFERNITPRENWEGECAMMRKMGFLTGVLLRSQACTDHRDLPRALTGRRLLNLQPVSQKGI